MDFLSEIERRLDLPRREKEQVMRELSSHYEELKTGLVESGMDEAGARTKAAGKMGSPQEIASRLQTVHMQSSWKGVVLAVLPIAGMLILFLLDAFFSGMIDPKPEPVTLPPVWRPLFYVGAAFALVMSVGCVRELAADRRPVWLATWLPAAFASTFAISSYSIQFYLGEKPFILLVIVGFSAKWLLALWAFRRSWLWIGILAAAMVLYIIGSLSNSDHVFVYLTRLVYLFLMVALAIKLFGLHRYGSLHQVWLALFAFSLSTPITSSAAGSNAVHLYEVMAIYLLFAMGVTAAFVRSSTHTNKLAAIYIGVVGISLSYLLDVIMPGDFGMVGEYAGVFLGYSILGWIIRLLLLFAYVVIVPSYVLNRRTVRIRNTPPMINA